MIFRFNTEIVLAIVSCYPPSEKRRVSETRIRRICRRNATVEQQKIVRCKMSDETSVQACRAMIIENHCLDTAILRLLSTICYPVRCILRSLFSQAMKVSKCASVAAQRSRCPRATRNNCHDRPPNSSIDRLQSLALSTLWKINAFSRVICRVRVHSRFSQWETSSLKQRSRC